MISQQTSIKKSLNKAYLKVSVSRQDFDKFKAQIKQLVKGINTQESEEFHKNLIADFLKNSYYSPQYFINTKERYDLVIHSGKDATTKVGVIIETKSPKNRAEMCQLDHLNCKALQELLLYFLRERITNNNLEIKHLIVTNIEQWFIFDAREFERLFINNKELVRQFKDFEEGRLSSKKTDLFYQEIAQPMINKIEQELNFTYFSLNTLPEQDREWIDLYKIFSPQHLLKLPFANDSNSLDRNFYNELLYIIGLTEVKDKGKKLIQREQEGKRNLGSLLENVISQLKSLDKLSRLSNIEEFGETETERLFNIGLELVITWINRILFLKLLEAQLIRYHQGDLAYSFLNLEKIKNYDDLNSLFFEVLACKYEDRNEDVREIFINIPYLNSSLFEPTELEHNTIFISNLKDKKLPIFSATVLKDSNGKKLTGELNTLEYLFKFLDAYDFGESDFMHRQDACATLNNNQIVDHNKPLINASVLGLIFEKINGYKDGSFFTPGFITMYMCRETITRAIIQKFNTLKGWDCQNIDDLYDKIEDKKEANQIINSLKICDPAVGSGHFLVSALNEIIAIKSKLKILLDKQGKTLRDYEITVENDELIIINDDGDLFEYNPQNKESQRIQEALFHEKQTIIENCLFGVDINPNSVKICRLRLWIELLKNAYYKVKNNCGTGILPVSNQNNRQDAYSTNYQELETLPNIDINIKCGNSLISRFALDSDLKKDKKAREKKITKLQNEIDKLKVEIEEIENGKLYQNAFEWRFEFPEVLDDQGNFIGFDVVIGNPPYIRQEEFSAIKPLLKQRFTIYNAIADLLTYFVELGFDILQPKGVFQFIISNKFTRANYGKKMRSFLLKNTCLTHFIDFSGLPVFDEATVDAAILGFVKVNPPLTPPSKGGELENKSSKGGELENKSSKGGESSGINTLIYANIEKNQFIPDLFREYLQDIKQDFLQSNLTDNSWSFEDSQVLQIKRKVESQGVSLKDWDISINYGIKTGYNEAFIIDGKKRQELIAKDAKSEEIIKPLLRGRDLQKYYPDYQDLWLINFHNGYNKDGQKVAALKAEDYPAIKEHLDQFFPQLEKRTDKGITPYNLRNCAYIEYFEQPKIIYPNMTKFLPFVIDNNKLYTNQKCYILTGKFLEYLTAFFNSKLWRFCFRNNFPELLGGTRELSKVFFEKIPVKQITEDQEKPFIDLVTQILDIKKANPQADTRELEREIDSLVYELYGLTEDEIKIIES